MLTPPFLHQIRNADCFPRSDYAILRAEVLIEESIYK